MIESVQITGNGGFVINDAVLVHGLNYGKDGVKYSINYDESIISEKEAKKLSDAFIEVSLQNLLKKTEETENNC